MFCQLYSKEGKIELTSGILACSQQSQHTSINPSAKVSPLGDKYTRTLNIYIYLKYIYIYLYLFILHIPWNIYFVDTLHFASDSAPQPITFRDWNITFTLRFTPKGPPKKG